MKFLCMLFIAIITVGSTNMYQDRILEIDADGNIIGLPEEYRPAKFDRNKNYLRIKNKALEFPECVTHYFQYS